MPSGTGRWTERALPGGWAWRSLHWSGKHVSSLKVFKIKFFITVSYPNTTRLLTLFSPQDACVSSVILRPPQWQMTNLRFREPKQLTQSQTACYRQLRWKPSAQSSSHSYPQVALDPTAPREAYHPGTMAHNPGFDYPCGTKLPWSSQSISPNLLLVPYGFAPCLA